MSCTYYPSLSVDIGTIQQIKFMKHSHLWSPKLTARPSQAGYAIKGVFQAREAKISSASQNYIFNTFISGTLATDEVFLLEKNKCSVADVGIHFIWQLCIISLIIREKYIKYNRLCSERFTYFSMLETPQMST